MNLLIFAHRGEAQAFLHHFKFCQVADFLPNTFQSSEMIVAICGEGISNAQIYTSACLARFSEISNVFSLGVAGSLQKKLLKNKVYEARTIYAKDEFKSYQSKKNDSQIDLISSPSRVLDSESATKLSYFAQMVDREAYGVAKSSHFFKKNFRAIKVISDSPLEKDVNICDFVKEQANFFSDILLKYFIENSSQKNKEDISPSKILQVIKETYPKDFHFSFTMESQIHSIEEKLNLKQIQWERVEMIISSLATEESRPKKRGIELIRQLKVMLNPFEEMFNQQVNHVLTPLNDHNTKTKISKNLEKATLDIHTRIDHPRYLDSLIRKLKNFDWKDLDDIFQGKV